MWKRRILIISLSIVLLSSSLLYAQSQEDTAPTITVQDVEMLQQALVSILSLSQDNQTDLQSFNRVLENWKKEITELPMKQKEQSSLSIKAKHLEIENTVLKIGIGVVSVVAIGEGIVLFFHDHH